MILRKERPHPGAQLTFTDVDGMRINAILTDTLPGVIDGQIAGLELRHHQHARVEDRIRHAKATGLRNLPCRVWNENAAWLQGVLMAADLITWNKLIVLAHNPDLAKCEIAAFPYRVLQVSARITRGARQVHLRVDKSRRWGRRRSPPAGDDSAPPSVNRRPPPLQPRSLGTRPPGTSPSPDPTPGLQTGNDPVHAEVSDEST